VAFEVLVRLLGDSSGFNQTLDAAAGRMRNFSGAIKSRLAAVFSVGSLVAATRANMAFASSISDMSQGLGIGTTKLQEWDYAAKMTGSSINAFGSSLRALAKARNEALGDVAGKKMDIFRNLGIDEDRLRNMPLEKLFERIGDEIKSMDLGADDLAVVQELLGKTGQELLPAFKAGLSDAAAEAHNLGIILQEDVVTALDEAGDALQRISMSMTRMSAGPLVKSLRAVEVSLTAFQNFYKGAFAEGKKGIFPVLPSVGRIWVAGMESALDAVNQLESTAPEAAGTRRGQRPPVPDFFDKGAVREAAKLLKEEEAIKEKLLGLELKLLSVAERRSKVEGLIRKAMEEARMAEEFVPELAPDAIRRLLELSDLLDIEKVKPAEFQPAQSDVLSRVGGFGGAGGNPILDYLRKGVEESTRNLQNINRNNEALLLEVRNLSNMIINQP